MAVKRLDKVQAGFFNSRLEALARNGRVFNLPEGTVTMVDVDRNVYVNGPGGFRTIRGGFTGATQSDIIAFLARDIFTEAKFTK